MGAEANNMGGGNDFATGEYFVEFHRRINLLESDWKTFMGLMQSGKKDAAQEFLKNIAPQNAQKVIDLFFSELKIVHK